MGDLVQFPKLNPAEAQARIEGEPGIVRFMPGHAPRERRQREENAFRVRSNVLSIVNHFGLSEAKREYRAMFEKCRSRGPFFLECLERTHKAMIKRLRAYEDDNAIRFQYNKQGYYCGYYDADVGEVVRYRKGAE